MHKVAPAYQQPIAVLTTDASGKVTGSEVRMRDTAKVVLLEISMLQNFLEAGVGYGYIADTGHFIVLEVRPVRVLNLPGGARHFTALVVQCGGEDFINADAVLAYVAAHPEDPDFAAMGLAKENGA